MTEPVRVGEAHQLVVVAWSGKQRQREGSNRDAKGQQRRDGVTDMGRSLVRRAASVPKPLAAQGAGQQELAASDEQRDGVLHAWMLVDSRPGELPVWSGGGLGLGGEQPEPHGLGQQDTDQQRGQGTGSDPLVGRPVALAKPEDTKEPSQGQIANGEGGQQSAHAASITGLLVPHTWQPVEASKDE
jgi:hypothetical protein